MDASPIDRTKAKIAVGFRGDVSLHLPMTPMELLLPPSCEAALLERFLKAEAMALWAVRSAKAKEVPAWGAPFLLRHEEEEAKHLKEFESQARCPIARPDQTSPHAEPMVGLGDPSVRLRGLGTRVRQTARPGAAGLDIHSWTMSKCMWSSSSVK